MTYQKFYKNKKSPHFGTGLTRAEFNGGIVLVDVMIALSLGTLFIAIITAVSIDSSRLYERALIRSELMDIFESDDADSINLNEGLFGNDRIERTLTVATSTLTDDVYSMNFISVIADPLFKDVGTSATPICSVNFANNETVGSFQYFNNLPTLPPSAIITAISLPINPLLPLTDIEIRNDIAYVSTDSSIASDSDIIVFDIKDRENAKVLSEINTGPGIASFALVGKNIFAGAVSTVGQMHIIQVESPDNLIFKDKFKLPLPYATATPSVASSIFYDRNKIYLGTEKWVGDEFNVIDVSDLAHVEKVGGLEIGSKVTDIFVRDDTAYVASASQNQLSLMNVDDVVNPTVTNTFEPSGWERQEGKTISYFENGLSLGRTSGGFNIRADHEIFAWATTSVRDLEEYSSADIAGGVYGIVVDREHIFLTTRQNDKEIQIYDRNLLESSLVAYPLPVAPQTLTCDNDSLYVLAHIAPVIYEITFE